MQPTLPYAASATERGVSMIRSLGQSASASGAAATDSETRGTLLLAAMDRCAGRDAITDQAGPP